MRTLFICFLLTIGVCILIVFTLSTNRHFIDRTILYAGRHRMVQKNYMKWVEKYDTNIKFDKWIVITTVNYPTSAVRRYSQMNDWRLIVVGDRKTPKDWQYKENLTNCIFLSIDEQEQLNYRVFKLVPSNSYARKIVGYLYAIEHGAQWIYDTDDDNEPLGKTIFTSFGLPNTSHR